MGTDVKLHVLSFRHLQSVCFECDGNLYVSGAVLFLTCCASVFQGLPLDLLRCESLLGLDPATCSRVLNKNYRLLVSMAPLSNEIRPISSCTPQVMHSARSQGSSGLPLRTSLLLFPALRGAGPTLGIVSPSTAERD